PTIAGVGTLLTALPHHSMAEAKDFVRLHPNEEEYWSSELCFVTVPIRGQRERLHLITEDLAMQHLDSRNIQRFRLALATKPHNEFFLCHVPSQNLGNPWNETNLKGCNEAKERWAQALSRRDENIDGYKINFTIDPDAFPEPVWATEK